MEKRAEIARIVTSLLGFKAEALAKESDLKEVRADIATEAKKLYKLLDEFGRPKVINNAGRFYSVSYYNGHASVKQIEAFDLFDQKTAGGWYAWK
jgi:hypothetical protein